MATHYPFYLRDEEAEARHDAYNWNQRHSGAGAPSPSRHGQGAYARPEPVGCEWVVAIIVDFPNEPDVIVEYA